MATPSTEDLTKLDRVRIATPCPIGWEQMTGDSRVRFCAHCGLNVYNLSALSRIEAEKLIASTEGRLCARMFRRHDGTILTKDCPVGLLALRRRVAKKTAAIFAATLGLAAAVFGQQSSARNKKTECTPQTRITRTYAKSNFPVDVLSGTIVDPNGAEVPGATITATNLDTKKIDTSRSSDEGRFEFKFLAAGIYSIKVELIGFKSFLMKNVSVEEDKLTNIELILELDHATETVGILMAEPSLIDTPPGTTIINEKMIRSLPYKK